MQGQKQRGELEKLGKRILGASRDELYLSMRFLDAAFAELPYEMNLKTKFLGTDGDILYFNPVFLMQQYRQDTVSVNRAYLHAVFHCLFRHVANIGERDQELWDLACDIAVEELMDSMEDKSLKQLVPEEREELYKQLHKKMKVLTAEGIYHYLKKEKPTIEQLLHWERLFFVDDHQFFCAPKRTTKSSSVGDNSGKNNLEQEKNDENNSKENNLEQEKNNENNSKENDLEQEKNNDKTNNNNSERRLFHQKELERLSQRWKHISENMRTNLETFGRNAGVRAGGLLASLVVEEREQYHYSDFLRKFTRPHEEQRLSEEEFDTAFYTYGLQLYGNLPLVEPLEYREQNKISELVIVVDTSGSCQADGVQEFLKDTFAVLKDQGLFTRHYRVHLLQCDTVVHSDLLIANAEQAGAAQREFKMYGGGGTDFRAAFEYIKEKQGKGQFTGIQGLLYFTDGYGTFPEQKPNYNTAFLFWRDDYEDIPVPAWAYKMLLYKEDQIAK